MEAQGENKMIKGVFRSKEVGILNSVSPLLAPEFHDYMILIPRTHRVK